MKYFQMRRGFPAPPKARFLYKPDVPALGGYRANHPSPPQPAGLFKDSHFMFPLKSGHRLEEGFEPPFKVFLDPEIPNPQLPTFFESPAWIGTKTFYRDLLAIGIDNIEAVAVEMRDDLHRRIIHDYLLLNIVGCVPCADMAKSTVRSLGEGINVIDRLVVDASRLGAFDLCVAAEDSCCMIVSERVARHLQACGYKDILFEELEQA